MTPWHATNTEFFNAAEDIAAEDAGVTRLIPMTEHSLLTVAGADAKKFLQGQLTCDLDRLEAGEWCLGAHCSPKGRMISSFLLAQDGDELLLRLRDNIAESALAALRKYIVFSKATITPSGRLPLAISGTLPAGLPFPLPEPGKFLNQPTGTMIRRADDLLEIWVQPSYLQQVLDALSKVAQASSADWLRLYHVQAGFAEVEAATQEKFIPQMFNYQQIDGISFKKGCYTGQEIVARMQYRGQLKKSLYQAVVDSATPLPPGTELQDADGATGTVVESVNRGAQQVLLAVTGRDKADQSERHLIRPVSAKIQWLSPPYAIP